MGEVSWGGGCKIQYETPIKSYLSHQQHNSLRTSERAELESGTQNDSSDEPNLYLPFLMNPSDTLSLGTPSVSVQPQHAT
jgi:ATP-dependent helicase/DNAse subunit B